MWHVAGQIGIFQKDMGLSGSQLCFANWLGGWHFLGAKQDEKPRNWIDCWQISVRKRLLYPWGQLAVDESWVNMYITTLIPSKQIPGICLLHLGHPDVAGQVWDYWSKWFISRSESQAGTNDMKFEEVRFKVSVSNRGNWKEKMAEPLLADLSLAPEKVSLRRAQRVCPRTGGLPQSDWIPLPLGIHFSISKLCVCVDHLHRCKTSFVWLMVLFCVY